MSKKNLSNKSLCNNYSIDYGAIFEGRCSNSVVSLRESFTIFSKRTHCEAIICVLTKERPSILGFFFLSRRLPDSFLVYPNPILFPQSHPEGRRRSSGFYTIFKWFLFPISLPPSHHTPLVFPVFFYQELLPGKENFCPP